MLPFPLFLLLPMLVASENDKASLQDNSIKFNDESSETDSPQTRFLSPTTLETIGRFFLSQSRDSSCYSCSHSFPEHSRTCCQDGFITCCYYSSSSPNYVSLSSNRQKPGDCPYAAPYSQNVCSRQCVRDSDCTGDYKCCPYGCSSFCASPSSISSSRNDKPGICPPDASYIEDNDYPRRGFGSYNSDYWYLGHYYNRNRWFYDIRDNYDRCYSDTDCPGSQKCCLRGFRKSCTSVSYRLSYGR